MSGVGNGAEAERPAGDPEDDAATLAANTLDRLRLAAPTLAGFILIALVLGPLAGISQPPVIYALNLASLVACAVLYLRLRAGAIPARLANPLAAAIWLLGPMLTLATMAVAGGSTLIFPLLLEIALVAAVQTHPRWIFGTALTVITAWVAMTLRDAHVDELVPLGCMITLTGISTVLATHIRRGALAEARQRRELIATAARLGRELEERHRAEEERERLRDQFVHAQRVEAVGTLAAGLAHDMNNILGGIIGLAEAAHEDLGSRDPKPDLEQIVAEAQRGAELTRSLLAHARRSPYRRIEIGLDGVIDELRPLMSRTLAKQVTIERRGGTDVVIDGDPAQLAQVLMNLCLNGADAMDGVGTLTITTSAAELDATHAAELGLIPGRYGVIAVTDTGRGMDEATRSRVFEPFFTTRPVGQGTGLGLAVVHGIVASHRGAIDVRSKPGRCSSFTIHLPSTEAAVLPDSAAPPLGEGPQGQGQRVLYIDDDEVMSVMVEGLLQACGYQPTVQGRPARAVAAVRARPQDFDVVVTDFNMPGMSGMDVARELAAIRPGLPVIISSGYLSDELRAEAAQYGITELMPKENTATELALRLHRVLQRSAA